MYQYQCHFSLFLALGGTGKKIGIIGRRTGVISFVGLLRNRYENSKVLVFAVTIPAVVFLISYSATQIIGGARVFEAMTGSSYTVGLILFGAIIGIYTIFGGMKSVAATSIFQGFIMVFSVVALVFGYSYYVNKNYGGAEILMQQLASSEETAALLRPYGPWNRSYTTSMIIMYAVSSFALPHVAQGNLTYRDTHSLKNALLIGGVSSYVIYICVLLIGFIVKAINPNLPVADHVTAYLAFTTLPAPLVGVMLSAVASAIQSTVASMFLLITAAITKDVIKDVIKPDLSDKAMKRITPAVLAAVTITVIIFSLNPPDAVQMLVNYAISGMCSAFTFPLVLGLFWPRANKEGAIAGVITGFLYYIIADSLVPAMNFGMNGFIMAVLASGIVMVIVSLCTPKPKYGIIDIWFGKNRLNSNYN